MSAEVITWPTGLTPTSMLLQLDARSRNAGPGLNGMTQVISPLSPIWRGTMEFSLSRDPLISLYRGFLAAICGMANVIRVPICDAYKPTLGNAGNLNVLADAAAGAETIDVSIGDGQLNVGSYFSRDDYLYVVTAIIQVSTYATYRFAPALRADIASGVHIVAGSPTVMMRLASDMSGGLTLDMLRFGRPTLEFEEVLTR